VSFWLAPLLVLLSALPGLVLVAVSVLLLIGLLQALFTNQQLLFQFMLLGLMIGFPLVAVHAASWIPASGVDEVVFPDAMSGMTIMGIKWKGIESGIGRRPKLADLQQFLAPQPRASIALRIARRNQGHLLLNQRHPAPTPGSACRSTFAKLPASSAARPGA